MSSMMQGFGDFLGNLRGKMTLREAAKRSGLSHTYIRELENEKTRSSGTKKVMPTPETLKKLSGAYNYSYIDLMVKAGHLSKEQISDNLHEKFAIDFDSIWFLKIGDNEVIYCNHYASCNLKFASLTDFSEFMNELEDREFKRVDTHLYVNFNQIKAYEPEHNRIYFNEDKSGESVVMASIRKEKYHQALLHIIRKNTNQSLEITLQKSNDASLSAMRFQTN